MQLDDGGTLNRLAHTIASAADDVGPAAARVVTAAASRIEALGQQFAPVDTGFLRSSITTTVTGDGRTSPLITAEIGPEASYGAYVEFGTARTAPQAYMGPALDRVSPDYVAAMEQLGAELLESGHGVG